MADYYSTSFEPEDTNRRYVRVVKETDLKSVGLRPRRFEPCCRRSSKSIFLQPLCFAVVESRKSRILKHKRFYLGCKLKHNKFT